MKLSKDDILQELEKLKIDKHLITTGSEDGINMIFVEIPESRKATIKKLESLGFKFRQRFYNDYGEKYYKQFGIKY